MVSCPLCNKCVQLGQINGHIDSGCATFLLVDNNAAAAASRPKFPSAQSQKLPATPPTPSQSASQSATKRSTPDFFSLPAAKRQANASRILTSMPLLGNCSTYFKPSKNTASAAASSAMIPTGLKRSLDHGSDSDSPAQAGAPPQHKPVADAQSLSSAASPPVKKQKMEAKPPLAERMRPSSLDEIAGQELVGRNGVLRAMIESGALPSMILWGASGTGKTTIARVIASMVSYRFIEINATSSGVPECKKLFQDAANELSLTGRRTIIFCDEIHRFSKTQQDVFLKPVEVGTITLIGATTENPSFRLQTALLSRCRTFTLQKLSDEHILAILMRALAQEFENDRSKGPPPLIDQELLTYFSALADGDARAALNLLELAISLATRSSADGPSSAPLTKKDIKVALTKTFVYDRAGDQHYDTISAFHKSVRGSDPHAALYYLARMLQSGEDALFVARRMVVIASEDVGLADNSLLSLATATYAAVEKIGMPEARIPLAHCACALCLAPKSTRAYRGLNNAYAALREPGVAGLPVPIHLRNAPTKLMKEMGFGKEYKYNANYKDGRVVQDYLPDQLRGRTFLEDRHLGTELDPDLDMTEGCCLR